MNIEAKRTLRKLRQIARGLRLSLAGMDLSDSDRLVVLKILRSANAEIQDYKNQLSELRHPKSPVAEARPNVIRKARSVPAKTVNGHLVGQKRKKDHTRSLMTSFPKDSETVEWKKPWNEVSGGSYGLGKSRRH